MRLRNWIAVALSVILLIAVGTVGLVVNRSALQAADAVHREDSRLLALNNATLTNSQFLLSAGDLGRFAKDNARTLGRGSATARRKVLDAVAANTNYFQYGLTLTDTNGAVLASTAKKELPPRTDPGYVPLRRSLAQGQAGFSGLMKAGGTNLQAVAVSVVIENVRVAVLTGYISVPGSQLEGYLVNLRDPNHLTTVIDSTGRIGFASRSTDIGRTADPAIVRAGASGNLATFVKYRDGRTDMVAVVAPLRQGSGWMYVRSQTQASFDGAVHTRSQTINLLLLAMLLIGIIGITVLGYRVMIQRRRADERFRALFQHAPDMVAVLDDTGIIQYASPSAGAVLGVASGALIGTSVFELVDPDDRDRMLESFGALITDPDAVQRLQCRVLTADGRPRWFEFTASNQITNPSLNGVVINARDITETREFQERLAHEALHDPLTGLPNRRRLQDVLTASVDAGTVAVLFVDLDGFKPVNDEYGHEAGDELLRQVAYRLSSCVRAQDVLARVGGDEFVMLMPGVLDPGDAAAMSVRVREALGRPFLIAGHTVTISASVGVHMASATENPDQALRAADHAMYLIKRAGGGRPVTPQIAATGRHRAAG